MLKSEDLKSQLQKAFETYIPQAIERCKLEEYPSETNVGNDKAKKFANTFSELLSEPLANAISEAIDSYIKNASITGTIITTGSPVTQTSIITSMKTPIVNGKIPNTLGIS